MFLTSKNRLAEGRFGTMFKKLPAFAPSDDLLTSLAETMVEDQTAADDIPLTPAHACSRGSRSSGSSSTTTSRSTKRRLISSRRIRMPLPTSGRRATTSIRSTAWVR